MAFTDQKITPAEVASSGVQSQPNKLTGSAQQNKAAFDKLIAEVVAVKFNALIDELRAITAAGQIGVEDIGGLSVTNLQDALEAIKAIADAATTGEITPGSLRAEMYADGSVVAAKLGGDILPANVGIKFGTAAPTAATLAEGEIYLKYSADE